MRAVAADGYQEPDPPQQQGPPDDRPGSEEIPLEPSLPGPSYTDEREFARERDVVLLADWFCVGREESLLAAGDYLTANVAGESIVVVRNSDGLEGFYNLCRHRGSRICLKSEGRASVLVCPYHAWAYNLDGSLRSARYMAGDFDAKSHGLKSIHLRVVEGLVLISFAEDPRDLLNVRVRQLLPLAAEALSRLLPHPAGVDELNGPSPIQRLPIAHDPHIRADACVVEHVGRQADDRLHEIVLEEMPADLALT